MVPPGTRSPCGLLLYLRGSLLLYLLLLLFLASLLPPGAQAGKVLVFPVDGSHWVNMKILIQGLHDRGHQVTVVRTASTWYVKEESPLYDSITVVLPEPIDIETPDFFVNFLSKMMAIQRAGASPLAFAAFWGEILTGLAGMHHKASQLAVEMFENRELMQRLREAQYDLALIDPGLPAGVLVAHALGLPTVFNVRWITSGEAHFVLAPCPISYVPQASSMLSDTMSFAERVKNAMTYAINAYIDRYVVSPPYELVAAKYFGPEVNFYHLLQATDLWLLRADFVFDFPRPTMPNIVYVGGFQCGPAQPLPPDLEAFVEGSGEHGVILMSLGTLVKGLPIDITSEIAAGFARLPQRVIWRYSDLSEPPRNLGNNTLLVKWMPQNDLLGHPKTRAFVAHGGTNGIYEAIYHGVPIVGVPLLFDQPENMLRMQVCNLTHFSLSPFWEKVSSPY
ncbi:UDP-glucuronosyltransferase 2A2-like [Engraulis encrasicolus]|uniref:UDP-glucuronosyltransferase 2A2-like n=1 Tax=Engraulis encrasicolus TaxID=184585 RepID=UPI002FD4C5B7